MLEYVFLNKSEKEKWLPQLFELFYENMSVIAPSGIPYEEEKREWLANVSPALDKAPRQIIMCFNEGALAGYIQYYTRDNLLMIEEIQLAPAYHRTMLFYRLCRYLADNLTRGIEVIEAYAEWRNSHSQRIMKKLGMEIVDEEGLSEFVHLRGSAECAKRFFGRGR